MSLLDTILQMKVSYHVRQAQGHLAHAAQTIRVIGAWDVHGREDAEERWEYDVAPGVRVVYTCNPEQKRETMVIVMTEPEKKDHESD